MESWFRKKLRAWYERNKRDLPWRETTDPYKIWLSEIILQQTQVAQGLAYYLRFTSEFPSVKQLARAPEDKVMKLWQGLGYYSRARNLHHSAKQIVADYQGKFPESYTEIRKLKGVGDYTAAAIASIAYGLPHAVADGNVQRVLSRFYGIYTATDSLEGKREIQARAQHLLEVSDPSTHNQALMELGATCCRTRNPDCSSCPVSLHCHAFKHEETGKLPVKAKKIKSRERYFNYLVLADKNNDIAISKRNGNDIWKGLYEFHLVETDRSEGLTSLLRRPPVKSICNGHSSVVFASEIYLHQLTHQKLHTRFFVLRNRRSVHSGPKVSVSRIKSLPFPRLIEKFLNDCNLKELL